MIEKFVSSLLGLFASAIFCICANIVFQQERGLRIKFSSNTLRPSDAIYGYHFGRSKGLLRKVAEHLGLEYSFQDHKCYEMKLYTIEDPDSRSTPDEANMRLCQFDEIYFYLQKISDREFVEKQDSRGRDQEGEVDEEEEEDGREDENVVDYLIFHKERQTREV